MMTRCLGTPFGSLRLEIQLILRHGTRGGYAVKTLVLLVFDVFAFL